jgi:protein-S-isoprenylcysteine O-methyltransferase Ste14
MAVPPGPAEQQPAARIGGILFRKRSWLPVPLLLVLVVLHGDITPAATLAAGVLLVLGESWRLWAVAVAGTGTRRRGRRVRCLVKDGPFARHRNPLYAGTFLIWMGVVTFSGVLWFLPIAMAAFVLEYHYIVRYEEAVLESHFGVEYLEYKARTPRWLPRPASAGACSELRWREAWRSEVSTFLQYAALLSVFIGKQLWLHPY